jgi:hypothetical protein
VSSNEPSTTDSTAAPTDAALEQLAVEVALLESLGERPLGEHAAVYQQVHTGLQEALGGIDSA